MNDDDLLALDGQSFVEAAYLVVLGRPVDPQGLLSCLERVGAEGSKQALLAELRASAEARARACRHGVGVRLLADLLALEDDAYFVQEAFVELRGEPPSDAEQKAALSALAVAEGRRAWLQGLRRQTLAAGQPARLPDVHLLDLTPAELERSDRCSLDDLMVASPEAFVHLAYRRLLGRDPDPTGRAACLQRLTDGAPRALLLQEMRRSPEGHAHGAELPGLADAATRARSVVQRLQRLWTRLRPAGALRDASNAPQDDSAPASGSAPSEGALPARTELRAAPASHESPLAQVTAALARRLAAATPERHPELLTDAPMSPHQPTPASPSPEAEAVVLDRFVGPWLAGWSSRRGEAAACALHFGGRLLGSVEPDRRWRGAEMSEPVAFEALLGGLLQFSALEPACDTLELQQIGSPETRARLALPGQWAEALSFSPLKALGRMPEGAQLGRLLSVDFLDHRQLAIMFEAAPSPGGEHREIVLDAYQAGASGSIERLARYAIRLAGQVLSLEVGLHSRTGPLLLVVSDSQRRILLTDCLPLPEMHAEIHRPLIEYHSLLTGGQSAFDVAAKIGRAHLDAVIRRRLAGTAPQGASAERCVVLVYSLDNHDFMGAPELAAVAALGRRAAALRADGQVVQADGQVVSLPEFVAGDDIEHVLFVESRSTLRPDFWAVLAMNRFRLGAGTQLVHWDSIWLEGLSRPFVAKQGLLLDPALVGHDTIPLRSALLARDTLLGLAAQPGAAALLRSGALRLEQLLAAAGPLEVVRIPIVMDSVDWPTPPSAFARAEHHPLPTLQPAPRRAAADGISAIINYRNSPEETIQGLRSLRAQVLELPLEVVLVNNLSAPDNVEQVSSVARELFGTHRVQTLDYAHEFNHSAQCNLAAKVARHELLLMLSNDSVLLTPDALELAAGVACVPWVATAGFRIIGYTQGKSKLQSLGLGLAPRQMLFHGGSPLATYRPPAFLLNHTQETLGNTFAAVMVRRQTYLELGGLDEEAFPTNYNDVDFCCRALQHGLRHVAIGAAVVQHVGRGSREMDLDLPIDQRIVQRCPDHARLTSVGVAPL